MTEDQAFLQAIAEQPDDDAPRLIYADYLEERGQVERAEFIRVQIELSLVPALEWVGDEDADPKVLAWMRREEELLMGAKEKCNQNALVFSDCQDWQLVGWDPPNIAYLQRPYEEGDDRTVFRLRFRRGFVDWISTTCLGWLKQGARLIRAVSMVQEVVLTDKKPGADHNGMGGPPEELVWLWLSHDDWQEVPHWLPFKLFRHLEATNERDGEFAWYYHEEDARKDLSQACLAYAKSLVE